MSDALGFVTYLTRERAAMEAAARREADEIIEALGTAVGGSLPDPTPFGHQHIRELVRVAFMAGTNFQLGREKASG